jgi:predicted RecB family nuclease
MNNRALIEEMGFFERDGWMCNPNLDGEAVFKINDLYHNFETADLKWILSVITASASNFGSRWSRNNERANLARELMTVVDELNGTSTHD